MTADPVTRIARYRADGHIHFGRREGDGYVRLTAAPWRDGREAGGFDPAANAELLAPVEPGKIVCVGLNYRPTPPRARRWFPAPRRPTSRSSSSSHPAA